MLSIGKQIFEKKAKKRGRRKRKSVAKKKVETVILPNNKSPKVILDANFVHNYLKEQNKLEVDDMVQNMSIVSLNDSIDSDGAAEKSVVFVSEFAASREMKKIAQLNDEVSQLTHRNKKLELHVKALQTRIRNPENESQQTGTSNEEDTVVTSTDDEKTDATTLNDGANSNDFSGYFDEEWADEQIKQWRDNGELSIVLKEFEDFVMHTNLSN